MCRYLRKACLAPGGLISISDQKGQIHPDVHLENLKIVTIKSASKNSHCSYHPGTNSQGNLPQHPWILFLSKEKNSPLGPPFVWPPMWRIFFKKLYKKGPACVGCGGCLGYGGKWQQLPWLLWLGHLIVVTQTMFTLHVK
jgi:hypothetical protein